MDLIDLQNFISYKPIFDKDVQNVVDLIKKNASQYLEHKDIDLIQSAYEFAKIWHWEIQRQSWEYYISHPVLATKFLMLIKPDLETIVACLLHDVIEDTDFTYEDIKNKFWTNIANICSSLVKVSKIKFKWETRQIETLKKMFLSMWDDLRILFIKIADRIHNVQTLNFKKDKYKINIIAQETLKIYVPIAQRLWLSVFQWYLENWAFRVLNEKEFNKILDFILNKIKISKDVVDYWILILKKLLEEERIEFNNIIWRIKSPYRVYKKMEKNNTTDLWKITDILAFRITTTDVTNCYSILWAIHSKFKPLIKWIKDYIAVPKSNWYKSLHTVVVWICEIPVEIQIRTDEMDKIAEFWVASHFAYKEFWKSVSVSPIQSKWIQQLKELVKEFSETEDKEWFKDRLQVEVLEKNIFVYSPKWDIIELIKWSSVLDFAFRIHTDKGLRFKNAIVNWKIVPIDYELKTWDLILIKTYKNRFSALPSRINYLHNSSNKSKLNKHLKYIEKRKFIKLWEDLLNNRLKDFELPILDNRDDKIHKLYKNEDIEIILFSIWKKDFNISKFLKKVYPNYDFDKYTNKETKNKELVHQNKSFNQIIIDYDKQINYSFCKECNPQKNDLIIAKTWKQEIKIHKIICKSLRNINLDRLFEAHWDWEIVSKYLFSIKMILINKPWILIQILNIIYFFDININDIKILNKLEDSTIIEILIDLNNPSKSSFLIKELKNKKNLVKIIDYEFI